MGLLGFGAVSAMQKSIKDNRALRKDRKSLKDISENYHEKHKTVAPSFKKMSDEEFSKFKIELLEKKAKEKKQRLLFLGILISLGVLLLFLIKFNLI